jgi:hypothetical protein
MSNVILCKDCHRTDQRKHYYSYEWADRSGAFDKAWICPHCGGSEFAFVSASPSDLNIPVQAMRRLDAVLRALEVNGGPILKTETLTSDWIIELDSAIRAVVEEAKSSYARHRSGEPSVVNGARYSVAGGPY